MSIIKKERSKMTRQLKIYYRLTASKIIGPNDIMHEFVKETKDDPDTTPESIETVCSFMIPDEVDLPDIKEKYYALFPDSNERTLQRDFKEMNRAGFNIYYSRKHKAFIFEYDE